MPAVNFLPTRRARATLAEAASQAQRLGISEALNLDGGSSVGLAQGGQIRIHPRTPLTQALVIYDGAHPAPRALQDRYASWIRGPQAQASSPR